MSKSEQLDSQNEENDWVIRFLNLPHPDQIEFLYRHSLDKQAREALEKRVFDN
ncbi:hypothetical protein RYX45_14390 [Alkalihalophilus pseudofirmus]|uniref:Uncharacterized protein n=1 Tax=Alkalihalophilus pseudofirmus TaxID=79885 RepID=A0AAJ2NPU0_ALKPS|nr:hypothetical protein [Alkalihalophilus pseudofirmus]MDV2886375.1 hypothetical protein [Alkalihalophilus pseudofirmus]